MKLKIIFFLGIAVNFSIGASIYQCDKDNFGTLINNNWHMRGTSLGGWLVLEPWITPSLFYQFLGMSEIWGNEAQKHVAIDSYSFCTALGNEEANRQLRRHWASWVTEKEISELASTGIDTLRIPVGDWLFVPYEPYIGCFDGAIDELDRVIVLSKKYNLNVLIDIHAMKGGQNANDNSGKASIKWNYPKYETLQSAEWMGYFDPITMTTVINFTYMNHSLNVVRNILQRYKSYDNVIGLEAVNEPWYYTPIDQLKEFYWNVYQLVQTEAPHWISLFHDSFRLSLDTWGDFLKNCNNFAFDSHLYLAWQDPVPLEKYLYDSCDRVFYLREIEAANIPVVVGEWSLATDNCAMWLNGFNNNVYGYPKKKCEMIKCPNPYMGLSQPGAPPNSSKGLQEPFGTGGISTPLYGYCPRDSEFDDDDTAMKQLAISQLEVFESTHGQFFWNFRTEFEPKWDYLEAVRKGWLPNKWTAEVTSSLSICNGICYSKKNESKDTLLESDFDIKYFLLFFAMVVLVLCLHYYRKRKHNQQYMQIPTQTVSWEIQNQLLQIEKTYQNNSNLNKSIEMTI